MRPGQLKTKEHNGRIMSNMFANFCTSHVINLVSRWSQNNSPARYCVLVSRGVWKSVLSWKRCIMTIIFAQCRCFCSEKWSSNSILCSEQLHIFHNPDLPSYLLHYSSRTLNTHSLAMSWGKHAFFLVCREKQFRLSRSDFFCAEKVAIRRVLGFRPYEQY